MTPWRLVQVIGVFVLTLVVPATADERLVVSATATTKYSEARAQRPKGVPETYTFYPGQFHGGRDADRTLKAFSFERVARVLAPNLQRQGYLPTPDPMLADLLLVVHWGVTEVYEDPNRDLNIDQLKDRLSELNANVSANGIADAAPLNETADALALGARQQEQMVERNARLLGYKPTLAEEAKRIFASTDEQTMRLELAEPRYFVVVLAYDYAGIRSAKQQPPKPGAPKPSPELLWVTRISVRSAGNNFAEAMPALSKLGGDYFGQQVDGLKRLRRPLADLREGVVEIGEASYPDDPPPATAPTKDEPVPKQP